MPEYKAEIASIFNEGHFVDYALKNYDRDTALVILADQIEKKIEPLDAPNIFIIVILLRTLNRLRVEFL
jgi:hypothetical protein